MWPLGESLARPLDGTKLLVSNVRRRFARYVDPNGEEILLGLRGPNYVVLILWHIGRERG